MFYHQQFLLWTGKMFLAQGSQLSIHKFLSASDKSSNDPQAHYLYMKLGKIHFLPAQPQCIAILA